MLLSNTFYVFHSTICSIQRANLNTQLVGSGGCHSNWYWSNWGYYWGRWYRTVPVSAVSQGQVGTYACGRWRAAVAWSFIGGFFWLLSFCLASFSFSYFSRSSCFYRVLILQKGIYVISRNRSKRQDPIKEKTRGQEHVASGVTDNEQTNRSGGVAQTEP